MHPLSLKPKEYARMSVPNQIKWPSYKKLKQNIINFPYTQYPFLNEPVRADLFKTMVQCTINQKKIEKVASLKCENIIGLKKIMKIKMKEKLLQAEKTGEKKETAVSAFSFYYEKVEYSLGHVLSSISKKNTLMMHRFNLDRALIKKTIANVIALLYKQGIISFLEFGQIGINQQGVIKVYIAPHVLFDESQYNPKTKVLVMKYLTSVLKQIDSKFPKCLKNKNQQQIRKYQPQLSIENDIIDSQQSFIIGSPQQKKDNNNDFSTKDERKDGLQNLGKSFDEDEDEFFLVSASTNFDQQKKNKEIDKNLEAQKLVSKVQQNITICKKSLMQTKLLQKQKIDQLTLQLQQIREKIRSKIEQKPQKNIKILKPIQTQPPQGKTPTRQPQYYDRQKCNHACHETKLKLNPRQMQKKLRNINKQRKSSLNPVNFYNEGIPNHKNFNCINIYHNKDCSPKSFFPPESDAMSVDTHEMEIDHDCRMPKNSVFTGMRNSLSPHKARKSFKMTRNKSKQAEKDNSKLKFWESVGGKSSQHIKTLLKPQFKPKKSNIDEQTQIQNEKDEKNSISLKKNFNKQPSQHLSSEKRQKIKNNQTNIAQVRNNVEKYQKGVKTVDVIQNDLKNLISFKAANYYFITPQKQQIQSRLTISPVTHKKGPIQKRLTLPTQSNNSKNPQLQLFYLKQTQYKSKQKQKQSNILLKKVTFEEKLKKVMQRTKKAINVLYRARFSQIVHSNFSNEKQM